MGGPDGDGMFVCGDMRLGDYHTLTPQCYPSTINTHNTWLLPISKYLFILLFICFKIIEYMEYKT